MGCYYMIPMLSIRLGPISHCTFRNPERPVQPVNWAFGIHSYDFFHFKCVFSFLPPFIRMMHTAESHLKGNRKTGPILSRSEGSENRLSPIFDPFPRPIGLGPGPQI